MARAGTEVEHAHSADNACVGESAASHERKQSGLARKTPILLVAAVGRVFTVRTAHELPPKERAIRRVPRVQ